MSLEDKLDTQEFQIIDHEIDNSYIEDDLEYARTNLRDVINEALKLVPAAVRIAKDSESPRSIEATSALIKSISDLNKDLIALAPKKEVDQKNITNQQNNYFLSTEDLFSKLNNTIINQNLIEVEKDLDENI